MTRTCFDAVEPGVAALAAGVPASLYGAELYDKLGIDAAGEPVPELMLDDLPNSDVAAYRRSMQFLADLDVSVVHPGHGHSFDRTRLHQLAQAYLASRAC
ncbi:hypothetical protein [Dactylosporangium sp. NPDC050588]|uniref:hypothetical protein n=1 Tax=Dactylosporangium sp. NPDC050588 TaxID=3157211 RepID=UPI0033C6BAE3